MKKYTLRPEVAAYKRSDGSLIFASHDTGVRREYEWNEDLAELTRLLETPSTIYRMAQSLRLPPQEVQEAIETLLQDRIVMLADGDPPRIVER